jgi:hypothetical protein
VITERMWARVLSSTNQPSFLSAKDVIVEDERGRTNNPDFGRGERFG